MFKICELGGKYRGMDEVEVEKFVPPAAARRGVGSMTSLGKHTVNHRCTLRKISERGGFSEGKLDFGTFLPLSELGRHIVWARYE